MTPSSVRAEIAGLKPYVPGLSIAEIQEKYGLAQVIKLASNENPLGTPPLAVAAVRRHAEGAFRYPQGGNPRLAAALGRRHQVDPAQIVVGNGSDEILDLLIRVLAVPGRDNLVCCRPCFSIYPIQGQICGVEARRQPLREDFSFDFDGMLNLVDQHTRLMFVTTPDNPSGYCPPRADVARLARELADYLWRARLPFSVNILAEEAALAALEDSAFYAATQEAVHTGRDTLTVGLTALGCTVWSSAANFLMFRLPEGAPAAAVCFEELLRRGVIIRPLTSYGLPDLLRVSVGDARENRVFLNALDDVLTATHGRGGAA